MFAELIRIGKLTILSSSLNQYKRNWFKQNWHKYIFIPLLSISVIFSVPSTYFSFDISRDFSALESVTLFLWFCFCSDREKTVSRNFSSLNSNKTITPTVDANFLIKKRYSCYLAVKRMDMNIQIKLLAIRSIFHQIKRIKQQVKPHRKLNETRKCENIKTWYDEDSSYYVKHLQK